MPRFHSCATKQQTRRFGGRGVDQSTLPPLPRYASLDSLVVAVERNFGQHERRFSHAFIISIHLFAPQLRCGDEAAEKIEKPHRGPNNFISVSRLKA